MDISHGTHGIALDGEDWYDVRHGWLIITPDFVPMALCVGLPRFLLPGGTISRVFIPT